jgi:hypothetical protein
MLQKNTAARLKTEGVAGSTGIKVFSSGRRMDGMNIVCRNISYRLSTNSTE